MNRQLEFWDWYGEESIKYDHGSLDQYEWAQKGWDAALKKILKLLNSATKIEKIEYGKDSWAGLKTIENKFIDIKVIKEIEKL